MDYDVKCNSIHETCKVDQKIPTNKKKTNEISEWKDFVNDINENMMV